MAENGRQWQKMGCRGYLVGNGFPRILRHGHRGSQEDHGRNGRKWSKMAENGFPRLFGRKWISACFAPFPYYFCAYREGFPFSSIFGIEWNMIHVDG